MVDADTVRRLAMALPNVEDRSQGEQMKFEVRDGYGVVWGYLRKLHPKKRRELDPACVAVRCAMERKELLIEAAPDRFFDDAHYRGYPALLVRLAAVDEDELAGLLQGAWELSQPRPKPKRTR